MHIVFITPGYPFKESSVFSFVRQIAEAMADLGQNISVLRIPAKITAALNSSSGEEPDFTTETTRKGSAIDVYRINNVNYLSDDRYSLGLSEQISNVLCKIAARRSIDVMYAHFWDTANTVCDFARHNCIPLFVANGESQLVLCKYDSSFFKSISGVVCVSSKCQAESVSQGYIKNDLPTIILPNGVDTSLFYPRDKYEAREQLGFCRDIFIVIFVGLFIRRKGANRVSEAISLLNIPDIKSIFLGDYTIGDRTSGPTCNGILFKGNVRHDDIPKYLACADVFCLPTLNEGCSNAIVEALACGLPIISSNLSFNDDILNEDYSIRVNPNNIQDISNAIFTLYHNKSLCEKMSMAALKAASDYSIIHRAERIIDFIKKIIMT